MKTRLKRRKIKVKMVANTTYGTELTLEEVIDKPSILLKLIEEGCNTERRLSLRILRRSWSDLDKDCLCIRRLIKNSLDNSMITSHMPPHYSEIFYQIRTFKLTRKGKTKIKDD